MMNIPLWGDILLSSQPLITKDYLFTRVQVSVSLDIILCKGCACKSSNWHFQSSMSLVWAFDLLTILLPQAEVRKAIRSSLGRMKWLKYVTPLILPKIVYRQGFMLHFLSNGNSNETGVFSPFLQKCQRSSIYGAFRTFYILQVLDIADFWGNIFRYLRICFLICRIPSTARNQFAITGT